jgi:MFS family permease
VVAGFVAGSPAALVTCIIVGGLLLGLMNTVLTESVMEATDLPRSVASSAYSAVRFLGGAAAPPLAALLWHAFNVSVPYWFAAASIALAIVTLFVGRGALARIDEREADAAEEGAAILVGDAA